MLVQCRSYRLLDSGGASRLESFGDLVVRRPCPSALWQPGLPASRWDSADLVLRPEADGAWEGARANQLGEQWYMASEAGFSLGLWPGQNGQVGAFPEQGTNWRWLRSACEASPRRIRVRSLLPLSRPGLSVPRGAARAIRATRCHRTPQPACRCSICLATRADPRWRASPRGTRTSPTSTAPAPPSLARAPTPSCRAFLASLCGGSSMTLEAEHACLHPNWRSRGHALRCIRPCSAVFTVVAPSYHSVLGILRRYLPAPILACSRFRSMTPSRTSGAPRGEVSGTTGSSSTLRRLGAVGDRPPPHLPPPLPPPRPPSTATLHTRTPCAATAPRPAAARRQAPRRGSGASTVTSRC